MPGRRGAGVGGAVGGSSVVADRRTERLSLDALDARGRSIGASLAAPALLTLAGDLGAGKTTLVQAICRGLGVSDIVTSPTFALIHEYAAPRARVVHCDLYRIERSREVDAMGLDEMLAEPDVIMLVEWPDRAGALLGAPTVAITLAHVADDAAVRDCTEVWSS